MSTELSSSDGDSAGAALEAGRLAESRLMAAIERTTQAVAGVAREVTELQSSLPARMQALEAAANRLSSNEESVSLQLQEVQLRLGQLDVVQKQLAKLDALEDSVSKLRNFVVDSSSVAISRNKASAYSVAPLVNEVAPTGRRFRDSEAHYRLPSPFAQ